jgi:hypothetical protein
MKLEPYTAEIRLGSITVGVDNIHYDVFLSPRFVEFIRKYLLDLVRQTVNISLVYGNDRKQSGTPEHAAFRKSAVFQRVLLFLNPEFGTSVTRVYRVSRLYDRLSERSALIMLAAWRGSALAATRAKYRPGLYDDEQQRARAATAPARPAAQSPGADVIPRKGSQGAGN